MKKFLLAVSMLVLWLGGTVHAGSVVYNQNLANETALAVDQNYSIDLGASGLNNSNVSALSAQANYAQAAPTAVTFTDGVASTATITVSSMTALHGLNATANLTVFVTTTSLNAITALSFTLNGTQFVRGDLWSVGASTAATATNIAAAINLYPPTASVFSATATNNVVTITTLSSGTAVNSFTITSSSGNAIRINGSASPVALPFTGGVNQAQLLFNINGSGVALTEGPDWSATTSANNTADSLTRAITGNATLNAVISVSSSSAVLTLTSKGVGVNTNYGIFSSSAAALVVTNRRMFGGAATGVSVAAGTILAPAHTFTTGLPVLFTKTAGTAPGQLVANTTYFAIPTTANSFKVAASSTSAVAGTAIAIATQTATGGGSFAFTPLAYSGKVNTGFKWQASNDNANWTDLSVSSVTYSSPSTTVSTAFWDLGTVNYRYIRLRVVSPTQGGIFLVVPVVGRAN